MSEPDANRPLRAIGKVLLSGLLIVLGVLDLILGLGLALLFTLGGIGGLVVGDPSGWILLGIGLGLLAVVIPWAVFRRRGRRERPGSHAAGED